tara:strand:- start:375 stop:2414 length:2040 start_codon:yes stop_codon:yes gene_type:complete
VPALFSDGMVMQRDTTVSIWGTSSPNEVININASWGSKSSVESDSVGNWKTNLKTVDSGGQFSLAISNSKNTIQIKNILLGEVWLAAGQSNMEMNFDYCCNTTDYAEKEILEANYPDLRMFTIKKSLSLDPLKTVEGTWERAIGENIKNFSAAGYFFAKNLHKNLKVPVGIIHASWGGSNAQAWASQDVLKKLDHYDEEIIELDNIKKENILIRDWFEKYKSIPLPSGDFDFLLAENLEKVKPDIRYFDYFFDNWKELDGIGLEQIKKQQIDTTWDQIHIGQSPDKVFNRNNIKGVTLFQNAFIIDDTTKKQIMISIEPEKKMPWGMWDYDIFINGQRIASSLMKISSDKYQFYKKPMDYLIDNKHIKIGENQLIIRILGFSRLGDINLYNKNASKIRLRSPWKFKLLAEEFFQINNYQYPYTAWYLYENQKTNFYSVPKKTIVNHRTPSTLFNSMIHPIIPYSIKGIIWYQGETNIESGGPKFLPYRELMPALINDFRNRWDYEMPFYFAQIAPYFNYNGMLPYFRNAQKSILSLPKTGMVVTLDIGENYDIHPSNKHDVGYRFSLLALNRTYHINQIDTGPILDKAVIKNDKIRLYFDNIGSGIVLKHGKNNQFEISGSDGVFYKALVTDSTYYIDVYSEKVLEPKFVQYAWSDTSSSSVFNSVGLPASPFSTKFKQ